MTARIPLVINSGAIQELQSTDSLNLGSGASLTSPTIATGMTLSYGTANQVQFLNASKQLVGDADLTFDGTTLTSAGFSGPLTGNVTGNVSGNAGTVTNGVYTIGDQTIGGTKTFSSTITGSISGNAGTATTATNQSGGTVNATTGSFSSSVTLSGGTANGVAYLNGSKVLTTGSALTFDGSKLTVKGGNAGQLVLDNSGQQYVQQLFKINGADNSGADFLFDGTGSVFNIRTLAVAPIAFSIATSPGTTTEQMRLTSTGLGIGTSSPTSSLQIKGGSKKFALTDTAIVDTNYNTFRIQATSQNVFALTVGSESSTTGQVFLDGSGNLGLGVTPSAWGSGGQMTVGAGKAITSNDGALNLGANWHYASSAFKYTSNGYATWYNQGSGQHTWFTAPSGTAGNAISFTQAMTLDASGNLALGTTSAGQRLTVSGSSDVVGIYSTTANSYQRFFGSTTTTSPYLGAEGNHFVFGQWGISERMRIDSSGNVGIGTSSPGTYGKFELVGSGYVASRVASTDASGVNAVIAANSSNELRFNVISNHPVAFYTNNTERMRIDSSGNVGIGTSSPNAKLQANGNVGFYANNGSNGAQLYLGNTGFDNSGFWNSAPGIGAVFDSGVATAGALAFYTYANVANSRSERMRIDYNGNVGIGTSSPSTRLHVVSSATNTRTKIVSELSGSLYYSGLEFARAGVSGGALIETIRNASVGGVGFGFYTTADNAAEVSGTYTERMRIDSSGNLLVGTTSTGGGKCVIESTSANQLVLSNKDTGAASQYACYFLRNNSIVGSIQTTNTATSFVTSSDYRLKENIQPMQNALGVVAQLNPVTYTWKADGSDGQGFIAHELQAVVPDCVTGEKDAVDAEGKPVYQGIDTSFLVATLTKAIQEQQEQINQLKAEVAALKGN